MTRAKVWVITWVLLDKTDYGVVLATHKKECADWVLTTLKKFGSGMMEFKVWECPGVEGFEENLRGG